jgi:hypothetical protein
MKDLKMNLIKEKRNEQSFIDTIDECRNDVEMKKDLDIIVVELKQYRQKWKNKSNHLQDHLHLL